MDSITTRLRSVDKAYQRLINDGTATPDTFHPLMLRARDTLKRMFDGLSDNDGGGGIAPQRSEIRQLSDDFRQCFDDLESAGDDTSISDDVMIDLYSMLGCVRGLVDAIYKTEELRGKLDWRGMGNGKILMGIRFEVVQ